MAKAILIIIMGIKKDNIIRLLAIGGIFRTRLRMVARIRLLAGLAKEIKAESLLGFCRLYESTGTGLPQPNLVKRMAKVPKGSRWAIGFKVNLPFILGVGSPSLSAIKAWLNSWISIAIKRPMIKEKNDNGSVNNRPNISKILT